MTGFLRSGVVFELCSMAEFTMISVCWMRGDVTGLIKALKFLQLVASHLMAFVNLAICVNLARIVVVCAVFFWLVFSERGEMYGGNREWIACHYEK